jgi:hypothetical protein
MKTIDLTPASTEKITVEKFLRLKKEGKLSEIRVESIVPQKFGSQGSFGMIRIKRTTPIYQPL